MRKGKKAGRVVPPEEMVRAAMAQVPVEEEEIRMALSAISKALESINMPVWKTVHLLTACRYLEIAWTIEMHKASLDWNMVHEYDDEEEDGDAED